MCEARAANSSALVVADVLVASRSKEGNFTGKLSRPLECMESGNLHLLIWNYVVIQVLLGLFASGYPWIKMKKMCTSDEMRLSWFMDSI
jgi:hypothetical protein